MSLILRARIRRRVRVLTWRMALTPVKVVNSPAGRRIRDRAEARTKIMIKIRIRAAARNNPTRCCEWCKERQEPRIIRNSQIFSALIRDFLQICGSKRSFIVGTDGGLTVRGIQPTMGDILVCGYYDLGWWRLFSSCEERIPVVSLLVAVSGVERSG
jgi:hypothetical protein